jgi:hypothetical protein
MLPRSESRPPATPSVSPELPGIAVAATSSYLWNVGKIDVDRLDDSRMRSVNA